MGQNKEKIKKISKRKALEIHKRLLDLYPERRCALNFKSSYELLVASRLSAQCTDIRVNMVTENLFAKYPTEKSLSEADFNDVAQTFSPRALFLSSTLFRRKMQILMKTMVKFRI